MAKQVRENKVTPSQQQKINPFVPEVPGMPESFKDYRENFSTMPTDPLVFKKQIYHRSKYIGT